MGNAYIRERARNILSGKWGAVLCVTFVAGIFGATVVGSGGSIEIDLEQESWQKMPDIVKTYLSAVLSVGGVLGIAQFILGGVVQLGYCKYLLKLHDGQEASISDLFGEFHRFRDGFVLSLLTALYTFLWTLLFIIPGIIAVYKYAMAPFILAENPKLKPSQAIDASKRMMEGRKMELFCLYLSFIGWILLCILTLGIGSLWLDPYMNVSTAVFYRQICPVARPTEYFTYTHDIPTDQGDSYTW